MTTLSLSLSSPTTSSGYGSEEDHSPIFHFPASPSSDQVTSGVNGGSKFNDDDEDDINIDIFGEICEYLELDEDDLLLTDDCAEIPSVSGAEDREPAQDLLTRLPGENENIQIIPLTAEAGEKSNYNPIDFPATPRISITNQCSTRTALKLSISPSREEISEDLVLETSGQCTTDRNRWSERIKTAHDCHISSSTVIRDQENPAKPRHQSRQNSIRLAAGNQRRKPVNQNEALPTGHPDKRRSACRRTLHELDDHRYFNPTPQNDDYDQLPVPVKVPKTSLDSTGSGITGSGITGSGITGSSRRSEKSILETFLLTKETLNANKGSDGMLAEGNIAKLYTGDKDSSSRSASTSSTSILERILIGSGRSLPEAFTSKQCSSTPFDSPDGVKDTAVAPPSESDVNYEIFNDNNCKYESNSILLEFLCEKLDEEVWTPSGDNGKVFSNEMDAIINSQTPSNQNDVWIHQYISDLL